MAIIIGMCSIVFLLFIIFDLIPIYRQKQLKAFWTYTILISFSYVVHILYSIGVKIPSPADPISKLVSFIFGIQN